MSYKLGDIFIGNFPKTQGFGENKDRYHAHYGLQGHNGEDFGCPNNTLILAAADGFISEIGSRELGTFDSNGYGNYIKVVHDGYLTLYAHLNDIQVKLKDHVVAGQLIGHSNTSGYATGPHLHFGVAPCDVNGIKTEANNGFSGYIDPNGDRCIWDIKNLTKPIVPGGNQEEQKILVLTSDFVRAVTQGSSFKVIASYLISKGLNEWLTANGKNPVDINAKEASPTEGDSIVAFLADLLSRVPQQQMQQASEQTQVLSDSNISQAIQSLPDAKKNNILQSILGAFKDFIFIQK